MSHTQSLVDHEEISRFEETVQAYRNLQIDPDRFMAIRLQHGVYGQRQDGVHMIRVKVPGGDITAAQLVAVADVLEQYAQHHCVHLTTRQDIQIHYVPLAHIPQALHRLAEAGLTTREACGNTVRNQTACPLAGVCPREHLDVRPALDGAVRHFLRHPLTQHLPRKFKISFSGCEHDCAQGMMHDLGVVAVKQDGRYGFKVLAGGGLGHKPREAIVVEEFIDEKDLLASMEALVSLHHRYSDRKRRAKARIKFLVERFGAEGFREKYREEFSRTRAALQGKVPQDIVWHGGTPGPKPGTGAPRKVYEQKQAGLAAFPISVPIGDITGPQLRGLAEIMERLGVHEARVTQDQNLMLLNVPQQHITTLRAALAAVNLSEPRVGDDVVACPGTSTCRLGITSSKLVAPKLNGGAADLRIRASGCHNGCAQPEMGDIGIYGEGKRLHGKLVPHYQMYFGGDGRLGGGIALRGPEVPAMRIEQAIDRVQQRYLAERDGESDFFYKWSRRHGEKYFAELLQDLITVTPEQVGELARDHGDSENFKVLQLGGGECAGAAQEIVSSKFAEAAYERSCRNSFALKHNYAEALECAEHIARLVGQSLLFIAGQPEKTALDEIAATLTTALKYPALGQEMAQLHARWRALQTEFDEVRYAEFAGAQDLWTAQAGKLCQSLDRQLDLTPTMPIIAPKGAATPLVDLTTYGCPLHYIKARNELSPLAVGSVMEFLLANSEAAQQVSSSLESDGYRILARLEQGTAVRITVRKGTAA